MNQNKDIDRCMLEGQSSKLGRFEYIDSIFITSFMILTKLFIFGLVRYIFYVFKDYDKDALAFNNDWVDFGLILGLLCLHVFFCFIRQKLGRLSLFVLNFLLFSLEILILLECEFSPVLMTTILYLLIFFFVNAAITKLRNRYSFQLAFWVLVLGFFISVMVLGLCFDNYFETKSFSDFKMNILIGGAFYGLWAILFFNVKSNTPFLNPSIFCFAISYDLYYIISEIFDEIKVEFSVHHTEGKKNEKI